MVTPRNSLPALVPAMPVALKERAGLAPASAPLASILDPALSREEVLERVDPDRLQTAPLNLLIATAIAISSDVQAEHAEDALLRYTAALEDPNEAADAYVRLTAEKLVLADLEYQASIASYAKADMAQPVRDEWKNPQHYLEACKVHERRMDRLLRTRKEAFERFEKAAEVYRTALLTREGQEYLLRVGKRPRIESAPAASVLPASADTAEGKNVLIMIR